MNEINTTLERLYEFFENNTVYFTENLSEFEEMMSEIRSYLDKEDIEIEVGQVWECVIPLHLREIEYDDFDYFRKKDNLQITDLDGCDWVTGNKNNDCSKYEITNELLNACFKLVKE